MKGCAQLLLVLTLCLCLSVPCSALTFFQADYDADEWATETVYEVDWLPLRELSSILPYTVEWKDRTIYVYGERTWTIKPDWYLPEGVKIVNGVTYVTPKYMKHILPNSFMHDGELYVLDGTVESKLIRGSERFKRNAVTSLYWMKVATPEAYSMVRECLSGGVESVGSCDLPVWAVAYVYPNKQNPTAYILDELNGSVLSGCIFHEAYHVYQYRHGLGVNEENAKQAERELIGRLIELN